MPIYIWHDKKSEKTVEILRDFSEYQDKPTSEEAVSQGLTQEEADQADWDKRLGGGIRVVKSPGWGGKGYW